MIVSIKFSTRNKMQDYSVLDVLSNKKVLCLEDEPYILKNMIDSLELFFAEVKGVKDGLEALNETMSSSYDSREIGRASCRERV